MREKLNELLNNVKDSYYDFVVGVLNYAKRNDKNLRDMTLYIENHPDSDTSDILEFMIGRDDYYDHAQRIAGVNSKIQVQA